MLYKGLQLVNPELRMNVNAKDIKTDRLDVVGGVRREKKLVGIGDKEREVGIRKGFSRWDCASRRVKMNNSKGQGWRKCLVGTVGTERRWMLLMRAD